MIRSSGKLIKLLLEDVWGSFDWNLSFSNFFRAPVVLSTTVVLADGDTILNEAKKRDFFFINPSFINNVSVLLIYCYFALTENFPCPKTSFDTLKKLIAIFLFSPFLVGKLVFLLYPVK